jgi:hypothetical protein
MGRCVAVDLLGMGDSDKLPASGPGSYDVAQQIRHLDAAFGALDLGDRVVLVVHEWAASSPEQQEITLPDSSFIQEEKPDEWAAPWPTGPAPSRGE